jgi:hypothetical protein
MSAYAVARTRIAAANATYRAAAGRSELARRGALFANVRLSARPL